MDGYSGSELSLALDDARLTDWRPTPDGIHARFLTGDFATGLELVNRIGAAAEEANHHPDLGLTYPHVDVALISHDVEAVTDRDLSLARRITDLATELGVKAE